MIMYYMPRDVHTLFITINRRRKLQRGLYYLLLSDATKELGEMMVIDRVTVPHLYCRQFTCLCHPFDSLDSATGLICLADGKLADGMQAEALQGPLKLGLLACTSAITSLVFCWFQEAEPHLSQTQTSLPHKHANPPVPQTHELNQSLLLYLLRFCDWL